MSSEKSTSSDIRLLFKGVKLGRKFRNGASAVMYRGDARYFPREVADCILKDFPDDFEVISDDWQKPRDPSQNLSPEPVSTKEEFHVTPAGAKLHLGCGKKHLRGWMNVDVVQSQATDRVCDVTNIDFLCNESVAEIYSCHMIEHINPPDLVKTLRHWFELLAPGGCLRVATVDIVGIVEHRVKQKDEGSNFNIGIFGHYDPKNDPSGWQLHKQVFTEETLAKAMRAAGFKKISRWNAKDVPEIDGLKDFSQYKSSLNLVGYKLLPEGMVPQHQGTVPVTWMGNLPEYDADGSYRIYSPQPEPNQATMPILIPKEKPKRIDPRREPDGFRVIEPMQYAKLVPESLLRACGVSIVAGTFNRLKILVDMVVSARMACDIPYEIVIVDAGSTDGTQEWCMAQEDITYVRENMLRGVTAAFNNASAVARGKYVCHLNDDVLVAENSHSISRAYGFMEKNPEVLLGVMYLCRPGQGPAYCADPHLVYSGYGEYRCPLANFGIMKKELGDKLGWWGQDTYTYGGDNNLTNAVRMQGRVEAIPDTLIVDILHRDPLREENNNFITRTHGGGTLRSDTLCMQLKWKSIQLRERFGIILGGSGQGPTENGIRMLTVNTDEKADPDITTPSYDFIPCLPMHMAEKVDVVPETSGIEIYAETGREISRIKK